MNRRANSLKLIKIRTKIKKIHKTGSKYQQMGKSSEGNFFSILPLGNNN